MSTTRNINSNAIYNTIRSVASIIYPILSFPYITRTLMTENLGKVNFGNSIISYFSLAASLGVTTYAIRECSKVKDDKEELGKLSGQIISINLLSTAISYIGLILLLLFSKHLESYRLLICIQSATILFATLGAEWLNFAMEDFRFVAIRTVTVQAVSLALLYLFVKRPEDYLLYAVLSVLASSGSNFINIVYRRKYCKTKITWKMDLKKHLPPIMLMFSMIVSQTVYTNSDMTILGWIRGDHEVGLYSTAVNIYNMINTTIASIAWVVLPQLTNSFARKEYQEAGRLLKYALNFIIVLGLPCLCGVEIIAPYLISFIAGEAFVDAALSLRILGFALLCSFIGGWIGNGMLIPNGKEKICLKASIICALINITLNFILIPKWGLYAAALTTGIAEMTGLIILSRSFDRNIKIDGLKKMVKGPLVGCAGIIGLGFLFQKCFHQAWLISITTIIGSIILYCGIMILMRNEFFMDLIRPIISKVKKKGENV